MSDWVFERVGKRAAGAAEFYRIAEGKVLPAHDASQRKDGVLFSQQRGNNCGLCMIWNAVHHLCSGAVVEGEDISAGVQRWSAEDRDEHVYHLDGYSLDLVVCAFQALNCDVLSAVAPVHDDDGEQDAARALPSRAAIDSVLRNGGVLIALKKLKVALHFVVYLLHDNWGLCCDSLQQAPVLAAERGVHAAVSMVRQAASDPKLRALIAVKRPQGGCAFADGDAVRQLIREGLQRAQVHAALVNLLPLTGAAGGGDSSKNKKKVLQYYNSSASGLQLASGVRVASRAASRAVSRAASSAGSRVSGRCGAAAVCSQGAATSTCGAVGAQSAADSTGDGSACSSSDADSSSSSSRGRWKAEQRRLKVQQELKAYRVRVTAAPEVEGCLEYQLPDWVQAQQAQRQAQQQQQQQQAEQQQHQNAAADGDGMPGVAVHRRRRRARGHGAAARAHRKHAACVQASSNRCDAGASVQEQLPVELHIESQPGPEAVQEPGVVHQLQQEVDAGVGSGSSKARSAPALVDVQFAGAMHASGCSEQGAAGGVGSSSSSITGGGSSVCAGGSGSILSSSLEHSSLDNNNSNMSSAGGDSSNRCWADTGMVGGVDPAPVYISGRSILCSFSGIAELASLRQCCNAQPNFFSVAPGLYCCAGAGGVQLALVAELQGMNVQERQQRRQPVLWQRGLCGLPCIVVRGNKSMFVAGIRSRGGAGCSAPMYSSGVDNLSSLHQCGGAQPSFGSMASVLQHGCVGGRNVQRVSAACMQQQQQHACRIVGGMLRYGLRAVKRLAGLTSAGVACADCSLRAVRCVATCGGRVRAAVCRVARTTKQVLGGFCVGHGVGGNSSNEHGACCLAPLYLSHISSEGVFPWWFSFCVGSRGRWVLERSTLSSLQQCVDVVAELSSVACVVELCCPSIARVNWKQVAVLHERLLDKQEDAAYYLSRALANVVHGARNSAGGTNDGLPVLLVNWGSAGLPVVHACLARTWQGLVGVANGICHIGCVPRRPQCVRRCAGAQRLVGKHVFQRRLGWPRPAPRPLACDPHLGLKGWRQLGRMVWVFGVCVTPSAPYGRSLERPGICTHNYWMNDPKHSCKCSDRAAASRMTEGPAPPNHCCH